MAGSARFTAVLDANTLYPTLVRDLLLSLAQMGLYHARWTTEIESEWSRNLAADRPHLADRLPAVVSLMRDAIPDCLVENHHPLIDAIQLPDPDDRHVVAAAIAGHADAIVTFNLKHFPAEAVHPHGIEVVHPDDFVMNQLQLEPYVALEAIKSMRARWKNPPRSADELIGGSGKARPDHHSSTSGGCSRTDLSKGNFRSMRHLNFVVASPLGLLGHTSWSHLLRGSFSSAHDRTPHFFPMLSLPSLAQLRFV